MQTDYRYTDRRIGKRRRADIAAVIFAIVTGTLALILWVTVPGCAKDVASNNNPDTDISPNVPVAGSGIGSAEANNMPQSNPTGVHNEGDGNKVFVMNLGKLDGGTMTLLGIVAGVVILGAIAIRESRQATKAKAAFRTAASRLDDYIDETLDDAGDRKIERAVLQNEMIANGAQSVAKKELRKVRKARTRKANT